MAAVILPVLLLKSLKVAFPPIVIVAEFDASSLKIAFCSTVISIAFVEVPLNEIVSAAAGSPEFVVIIPCINTWFSAVGRVEAATVKSISFHQLPSVFQSPSPVALL